MWLTYTMLGRDDAVSYRYTRPATAYAKDDTAASPAAGLLNRFPVKSRLPGHERTRFRPQGFRRQNISKSPLHTRAAPPTRRRETGSARWISLSAVMANLYTFRQENCIMSHDYGKCDIFPKLHSNLIILS